MIVKSWPMLRHELLCHEVDVNAQRMSNHQAA